MQCGPLNALRPFAKALAEQGVSSPLRLCDEYPGSVIDANSREIFVVDPNSELGDEIASAIAELLVAAVNHVAGSLC